MYIYIYIYVYILYENVTKSYKKANHLLPRKINIEGKRLPKNSIWMINLTSWRNSNGSLL